MSPPARAQKRKAQSEDEQSDSDEVINDMSDEEGADRVDGIYIPPPPKPPLMLATRGSRLVITQINNYFFKSYARTQKLGPFHKCFNAIVGPNGSGKSNVIDAMLFVFGYRASKIRSKKISVLLHNSKFYPNVQSCTVSVHFAVIIDKEGDAFELVPNSRFVVSRTANKDNSSYYQLNNRRVQFKEVAKLLRMYGIDLDHNRFLILQGEVEQIAMMKCKAQNEHETGMLEYLEDIIGTSRFKVPIVQLEERLELLADQRSEKLNRVKLVQSELNDLEKPNQEAIQYLKLENAITKSKNFLFQWYIHGLDGKIKEIEEQKDEVVTTQKELANQLADIMKNKSEKEKILKEVSKKYEELQTRKDKIKEAFNVIDKKDMALQEAMTNLNKKRKKTNDLLNAERKKLANSQKSLVDNHKIISECETKKQQLIQKKKKLEDDKSKLLTNELQELRTQREVLQAELIKLKEVIDETKSAYGLAELALKVYVSKEENEKKKLQTIESAYQNIKHTITEETQQVNELKNKILLTEKSLKNAQNDLNMVENKEKDLSDEISERRSSLAEIKATLHDSRSRGVVLDSLMQLKREGKCPGLFGRLGDLGAIDQKYDVAISTACGALDNIVVNIVTTAKSSIEFLREHDIGRATFITLDKQEHLKDRANSRIKTPENVPRLFDLVRIEDNRLRTAFYYALRDTLVAADLEQGSRIAYGSIRYRVVTLAGQVIETTGTMSGGGKSLCRGRMGQSVLATNTNPKDAEKMEHELENMDMEIRQLRQKQATFRSQINVLEPELREMKAKLETNSKNLKSKKDEEPRLAQQLKAQVTKCKSTQADPAVVKELTKTVNDTRVKYEEAVKISGEKEAVADQLNAELQAKTSEKLTTVDKNLEDVTNAIYKCESEIQILIVGIAAVEKNVASSSKNIATMEQDVADAETKLRGMKAQREEMENDGKQLLLTIESITEQLAETQENSAGVKQEIANMTKQENKLKSDKIEVNLKCENYDTEINQKKGEIYQWRTRLTQLKLQEIPDETAEELQTYTVEELTQRDPQNIQRELQCNEERWKATKSNVNVIEEYKKKQRVFIERSNELDELSQKKAKVKEALESVKHRRKEEFITGYSIIRLKLKEMYQMITLGGDADFEMVDTFDPFTEGIQFNVRPPKKSWKNISNLSGGEKTLSSLALVFALHYYKPSPLYVMDEIDAALDFKNVSIVANYIKERTKDAQFIIISLRLNMFELSDHLVGICKIYNCTKAITIDPRKFIEEEKAIRANQQTNQNPPSQPVRRAVQDAREDTENKSCKKQRVLSRASSTSSNVAESYGDCSIIDTSLVDENCQQSEMEVDD